MDCDKLLGVSTDIAYDLLESGAEIYRVEESIHRIFAAYGVQKGSIFAIPTLLILSIEDEQGQPHTAMRRLGNHGSDLARVNAYNDLCRSICRDTPPLEEIPAALARIGRTPCYSPLQQIFAGGCVAFAFTLLFGGGLADALCALVCGIGVKWILRLFERLEVNAFFTTIVASFAAAAGTLVCAQAGLLANIDKTIIGILMNLVPGVALTNVMRDIIAGDLVAGLTKLVEALLTATGIALGTGVALSVWQVLAGGMLA